VTEAAAVCVALSVKDGGPYLAESIEGVLAQEDVALELRIYDNGSTDGGLAVCERYRGDSRVSITANPPGSTFFDSMNRALAETAAPWFVPR
jgi:glycosyltransferase involved in cell wall biosynthesis